MRIPGDGAQNIEAEEQSDNLYEDRRAEDVTITNAILETGRYWF